MPWSIDGTEVGHYAEEVRDWQTLELAFRATESEATNTFRPLDDNVGKFDVIEAADGSFDVVDRSGGGASVTLSPPSNRSTLRRSTEFVVANYAEEPADAGANVFRIALEFVALSPKSGGSHGTATAGSDEWHWSFADGEIATALVEEGPERGGSTVSGARSIALSLTEPEAAVIEDSLNRQSAARVRPIADAGDVAEDQSGGRQTVTVTAPSPPPNRDAVLPSDTYVAMEWATEWRDDRRYEVSLELVPTG